MPGRDRLSRLLAGRAHLARDARDHLAFGLGLHQCIGQALARVELRIIFSKLPKRWPNLALAKPLADLEYMAFPRLAGYAEIAWSAASGRNWDEYKARLGSFGPRLRAWNVNFYESSAIPWQ